MTLGSPTPQPPLPLVLQAARSFRSGLMSGEDGLIQTLIARWLSVERSITPELNALVLEIQALVSAGEVVDQSRLFRLARYQTMLTQVQGRVGEFSVEAAALIRNRQVDMANLGLAMASDTIQSAYLSATGLSVSFTRLNVGAVESMVGLVGNGTPLQSYLSAMVGSSADGLTAGLVEGLALGLNPLQVAEAAIDKFGVPLNLAINTARTETLRVLRYSSLEQFKAAGIVEGYKRLSARDTDTCVACLMADDGTVYPLDLPFEEHNQGRCTPIPVLRGVDNPTWQTGGEFFEGLSSEEQASMLGPGRYEAWQSGQFDLSDLVTRRLDAVWGNALVPTPLSEL